MPIAWGAFVVFLLSNMPSPLYPIWQKELQFGASTTTILFTLYTAGFVIGSVALGRIVSRIGWRRSLTGAVGLALLCSVSYLTATHVWHLGFARLLSGLAAGIFLSCGAAAVTASFQSRGKASGPWAAALSTTGGLALGPMLGGLFMDFVIGPTKTVFALEAMLLIAAMILVARYKALDSVEPTETLQHRRPRSSRCVRRPPQYYLGAAVFGSCCSCVAIHMSIGSVYLAEELSISSGTAAGSLVFVVFAGAFIGQLAVSRISSQAKSSLALAIGASGTIALAYGITTATPAALFASAVLSGVSQGIGQLAGLSIARDYLTASTLRSGFGLLNVVGYTTGSGAVLLAGAIIPSLGISLAITCICILGLTLITAAAILLMARRKILAVPASAREGVAASTDQTKTGT
jgi:predicted MFS family arabinose efflux permease